MDSALTPRDIQARIRAGMSPEDVARAAGVSVDKIAAFVAPVLAERDHVAGLAQTHPVRRRGETTSHRNLRNAVADQLVLRRIDPASIDWDAWKLEDRRWQVRAVHGSHEALFVYDQNGRFSVAVNEEAHRLIGDPTVPQQTGRVPRQPDAAPTLVDDELAIVRAIQSPRSPASPPSTVAVVVPDDGEVDDAFVEGELAEVDGVYDIVPAESTNMDILYDMLSSFDEDSVKIYAGLIRPADEAAPTGIIVDDEPGGPDAVAQLDAVPDSDSVATPEHGEDAAARTGPAENAEEARQEPLVGEEEGVPTPPRKAPRRRGRASVPSWDEIMFGSPHKDR